MFTYFNRQKKRILIASISRVIVCALSLSLIFAPAASYAQSISLLNLPAPGTMITPSISYAPATMAGMTIHPDNPLQFDFIITTGEDNLQGEEFREESQKLINYFLATLTVPDDEMWVNLSPYEKDRIIADGLGSTEMGRDMLVQDYMLKQLTASLMYPEEELGDEFWKKVYAKSLARFGTTEIPTNTFNKVWIVPEEAVVYVNGTNVFVSESHLKVMLEEDYLALESNMDSTTHGLGDMTKNDVEVMSEEVKEVVRTLILPEIEREVNEGKNFANLRQIYHSMILATWYKKNLKESTLGQVYMNQNKVDGIDLEDKQIKEKVYNQYVEAFERGVYNYIKEDHDPVTRKIIPRKYFSGGLQRTEVRKQEPGESLSISSPIGEARRRKVGAKRVKFGANLTGPNGDVVASVSSPIFGLVGLSKRQEAVDVAKEVIEEQRDAITKQGFKVESGTADNYSTFKTDKPYVYLSSTEEDVPGLVIYANAIDFIIQPGEVVGDWVDANIVEPKIELTGKVLYKSRIGDVTKEAIQEAITEFLDQSEATAKAEERKRIAARSQLVQPTFEERELYVKDFSDPHTAMMELFEMQIRAGKNVGDGKMAPFFAYTNEGVSEVASNSKETRTYVKSEVPVEDKREADLRAKSVVERSTRQFAPGQKTQEASPRANPDAGNMTYLRRENIIKNFPHEFWLKADVPSGRDAVFLFNPFAFFPPSASKPASEQQLHAILTFEGVPQWEMHRQENLLDTMTTLVGLNQSESIKGQEHYRLGVNGWYYSDREGAPKAGASASQAHAQLARDQFPIEQAKVESRGSVHDVDVGLIDDEMGRAIVLETDAANVAQLASVAANMLKEVTDKGNSFNVLVTPGVNGDVSKVRVFLADKVMSTPFPHMWNEQGFAELGRIFIIDDPRMFWDMTEDQEEEYSALKTKPEQIAWVHEKVETGVVSVVDPQLRERMIKAGDMVTASAIEAEAVIADGMEAARSIPAIPTRDALLNKILKQLDADIVFDAMNTSVGPQESVRVWTLPTGATVGTYVMLDEGLFSYKEVDLESKDGFKDGEVPREYREIRRIARVLDLKMVFGEAEASIMDVYLTGLGLISNNKNESLAVTRQRIRDYVSSELEKDVSSSPIIDRIQGFFDSEINESNEVSGRIDPRTNKLVRFEINLTNNNLTADDRLGYSLEMWEEEKVSVYSYIVNPSQEGFDSNALLQFIEQDMNLTLNTRWGEPDFESYLGDRWKRVVGRGSSSPVPGGIDFNPDMLNLSEQGQEINFTIDNSMFENLQPNSVYGIQSVIINITPIINFVPLLGKLEDVEEQQLSS